MGKLITGIDEIKDLQSTFLEMERRITSQAESLAKSKRDLEEVNQQITAIISSIAEGLLVLDKDGKINLINPASEKILEVKSSEMLGKPMDAIFAILKKGKKLTPDQWPTAKALKTGKIVETTLDDGYGLETAKAKFVPVIIATAPLVRNKTIFGLVLTFRDSTADTELEEAKTGFISTASHQLRTPLTTMRWFSEMLLDGDAGELKPEQTNFMKRVYENTTRLIDLVNLLLQIARVESNRLKINPAPAELRAITESIAGALKVDLEKRGQAVKITTDPEHLPQIPMDHEILSNVIQNLISNASRYSPDKAEIFVNIIQDKDEIHYSIKDQGIGIPKDQQAKIFEKFFRATNASKKIPEGSGLGLSLVKSLVKQWNGKIWFETEENKGTTFHFTIPLKGMQSKKGEVGLAV